MKNILICLLLSIIIASCGKKNNNNELDGYFDITETSCSDQVTPGKRLVLFDPQSDTKVNVKILESSLNSIAVSFTASISYNDKKFVLRGDSVIKTQIQNYDVEFIIDAILNDNADSFEGVWVEKDDFGTITCNITAKKRDN